MLLLVSGWGSKPPESAEKLTLKYELVLANLLKLVYFGELRLLY